MNDLISRKELLDRLRGNVLVDVTPELEKAIEDQPTAFDTEKVMEELNNCRKIMLSPTSKDCFGEECKENDCLACVFNKAMEVIEKGGIEEE